MFKGNGYPESPEPILAVGGAGIKTDASLTENGKTNTDYPTYKGGENGLPASGTLAGSGYKGDSNEKSIDSDHRFCDDGRMFFHQVTFKKRCT